MPGGGKGPSSSGNVTQTTINPTQQAQLPFLTTGFQHAQDLYNNNPFQYYPGQTLADLSGVGQGYNNLFNTGASVDQTLRPAANSIFFNAANGGMGVNNSPVYDTLHAIGTGTSGNSAILDALAQEEESAGNEYANEFGSILNNGTGAPNQVAGLGTIANEANSGGNKYAALLQGLSNNGSGAIPYAGSTAGYGAAAANDPYAGEIEGMAQGPINGLGTGYGLLAGAGSGVLNPGRIDNQLLQSTARGDYLNSNPYLQDVISAATRPIARIYQTVTDPENNSVAEAAGRYGSGFHQNLISNSEEDLAKALGDTAGNIAGQDYANERGLQTQAQQALGSLTNQAYGEAIGAGEGIGNLGLGEFGARAGALNQAGNQYLTGLGEGITGAGRAADILQGELGLRGQLANEAGNQYQTGISNSLNAETNAGNLNLGDFSARLQAQQDRANAFQNAQQMMAQAYGASGGLENNALSTLQGGYDTGNRNSLIGLGEEPSVLAGNFMPASQELQAATGLSSIEQQQLNDAINRFYGNQQAPWQQLAAYMNLIGNPVGGSSSTTTPILGPSPFSSALGTLGSIGSLGNQFGLFGSGGLLGGAGLGSALTSSLATAAPAGSMFAALGGLGADTAGAALGGGLAEALPFLAL